MEILATRTRAESNVVLTRIKVLMTYGTLAFHWLAIALNTVFDKFGGGAYEVLVD